MLAGRYPDSPARSVLAALPRRAGVEVAAHQPSAGGEDPQAQACGAEQGLVVVADQRAAHPHRLLALAGQLPFGVAVQAAEAQAVVRREVGRGTRCATAFEVGGRGANESPGTAVVREVYEETGLRVRATQLLALWDKQRHPHPPQLPHALKAFFLCVIVGGELRQRTDETLAAGYHEVAALPPLSRHRVLESQIRSLLARVEAGAQETLFD
ncbi:NUDIX domain-containing protein [Pseudomonas aeruginosa]|nr:NUDIX domain-containing protein [Pseudomonas aeruginosa]MBG4201998.1 NUDIX domain-containing protein [Pseudomonas aeruginosa]MBG4282185.1 NUDIX domain-containing protein [Pseudomonas aeruginosa]MBG6894075.1 NUDIX domain-containing protein [Pseudomonas aeruginosa]